jgi:uncharacterized protein YeaO (DUF488 family)
MGINIKRIYEEPSINDGCRILVDRLWPRGVSKERAALFLWMKEVTPSPELRKWFCHDPEKFQEFRDLYEKELEFDEVHIKAVEYLRYLAAVGQVTLIYAARDKDINHAVILKEWVEKKLINK